MLRVERTALVLLAAGRSSRFGSTNKLHQDFLGRQLGLHAALALKEFPFLARIAVVDAHPLDYGSHGFHLVHNDDPASEMSRSVALGTAAAEATDADAILLALADMPRITAAHIARLFDAATDEKTIVASNDGHVPKPPVLFGKSHFAALKTLAGDTGARDLIRAGHHVAAPSSELIDIDTREALARAIVATPRP